jgi:hypothetical protein
MGERKGFQTYISPDFDPALVQKKVKKKSGDSRIDVRLAIPFSMTCTACNEFMYKGRKFNAKKETVIGETYLGLKIFRFYIKCTRCSNHITFKTDPKEGSYVCEKGSTRNFELYREEQAAAEVEKEKAEAVELDPMQALENKTMTNQAELDAIDALEEERVRRGNIDRLSTAPEGVLAALDASRAQIEVTGESAVSAVLLNEHGLSVEDEAQVAAVRFGSSSSADASSDSDNDISKGPITTKAFAVCAPSRDQVSFTDPGVTLVRRKRQRDDEKEVTLQKTVKTAEAREASALVGLRAYGSSDSDSN